MEWTLEEGKEIADAIRVTCLNMGYFVEVGEGLPSSKLELVFKPGDPYPLAEALANGMRNAFIYVNEANPDKLLGWLNKVWGGAGGPDPVAVYGTKQHSNNGGEMPTYRGKDSNNTYVYVNKATKYRSGREWPTTFTLGQRTIEARILKVGEVALRKVA